MNELKTIWRNADELTLDLDLLARHQNVRSVHQHLKEEEKRLKKYLPWTYGLVGLMLAGMTAFFYTSGIISGLYGWLGLAMVLLGSWCVAYFTQRIRIPYEDFAYAQPTLHFLYDVKDKLRRKRASMLTGIGLQTFFLTGGLTLLIFGDGTGFSPGALGGLVGLMLAIGGSMFGMMAMIFEFNYGKVRKVVNEFLADEETLDLV